MHIRLVGLYIGRAWFCNPGRIKPQFRNSESERQIIVMAWLAGLTCTDRWVLSGR